MSKPRNINIEMFNESGSYDGILDVKEELDDLEDVLEEFHSFVKSKLPVGSMVPFISGLKYGSGIIIDMTRPNLSLPQAYLELNSLPELTEDCGFTLISASRKDDTPMALVSIQNIIQAFEDLQGGK